MDTTAHVVSSADLAVAPVRAKGLLPFVSVIIPAYNDNDRLQICLDALAHQTYPMERFEVLVVDNGSAPPVEGIVTTGANVILLKEPRPGGFIARNTAILSARGDVLAFTDADCYPDPAWIEVAVESLGCARRIVGGHVEVFPQDPSNPSAAERYEMLWAYEQRLAAQRGVSVTANLVARRSAFDEVGLFNADSHSGHDFEWSHRASKAGYEVVYVSAAAVRTPARESFAALATRVRRFAGANYVRGKKRNSLWASRRWALLTIFKPPVRRLLEAATLPDAGNRRDRVALCSILVGLKVVYAIEWLRMEFGAEAERR